MRKRASRRQVTLAAVVIWGGFCAVNVLAEQGSDTSGKALGRSVSEFLTPDGRFDLEAARLSGFEGSLDLDDANLQFDPRTGEPRVRPSTAASPTDDPDDIYWDNSISPSIPGVNGPVYALTYYDNKLILGGSFSIAGGIRANNVAAWDGSRWSALGAGVDGSYHYVKALAVFDGKLIVGGYFTSAGDLPANNLASWDGYSWSTFGTGMNGGVAALTEWDSKLIVAGWFTTAEGVPANHVAAWDGSSWLSLGWPSYPIIALTVFNGKLVAGGGTVAIWDGSSWLFVGSPSGSYQNYVYSLAVYDNKLIAGGNFTALQGVAANNIASWDGFSWSPLGVGMEEGWNYVVEALTVYDGRLFAGGYFSGYVAMSIASWDGSSWSPLGVFGFDGEVFALTVYGGKLIVGGGFTGVGRGVTAQNVASWDATFWSAVGAGIGGSVNAVTVYDGRLIAGGSFNTAGGAAGDFIAAWDGSSWSPLGSGTNDRVTAVTIYNGCLVAAGWFTSAGGAAANHIAAWDGSSWLPLGSGLSGSGGEYALTVFGDRLIAAGRFTEAGGVTANRIASWDGNAWSALGLGISNEVVSCLTVYDGKLIAGSYTWLDGTECVVGYYDITVWDGATWSELKSGGGCYAHVSCLAVYNDRIIASGSFGITAWDGSTWSPIGSVSEEVRVLSAYDNKLIVGGDFTFCGVAANRIASWDGTSWSRLGSGIEGKYANALAIYNGNLITGGQFTTAGAKVSANLAIWTKFTTDVEDHDRTSLPDAFSVVQNYPNPFNPATTIEYNVLARTQVTIEIFNVLGQKVRTLVYETKSAGSYRTEWDGVDDAGRPVSTGVYLYRYSAGDVVQTKKMMLLK